ncbi:hypothetical protein NDU88_005616 [Pleurodeles waltl]|uniref:Uncharacterized protein n=1 Tax=Pleurodeles waltl TaxID=8319 RepID=A0AAV7WBI3_PLEWA|nr:hypothetical protein NDU88_005616 [Pleurodeles waltl]
MRCGSNSGLMKSGALVWTALGLWPKPVLRDGTVLRDPHKRCPQATVQAGFLVTRLELMMLALVNRGCSTGWDGASCTSRAMSTGTSVSRSVVIGDSQAALGAGDAGVRGPQVAVRPAAR